MALTPLNFLFFCQMEEKKRRENEEQERIQAQQKMEQERLEREVSDSTELVRNTCI